MQALFWIALFIIFYTYIGYGLLLVLLHALQRRRPFLHDAHPTVTFLVPAYNEQHCIEEKIKNCLSLTYPADKVSFLFVTDGSFDKTVAIIQQYPPIKLLHQPNRQGKAAAINRAMREVTTPFIVFSDANTMLHPESLQKLLRHYQLPTTGGVCGEKRIASHNSITGIGESLYWKYESFLKKAEANFYTVIGAAGELFSIRTALFQPLKENYIADDFIISATVCLQGYRFLYDSEAYTIETPSLSVQDEEERKIRISAGSYQALMALKGLLNPFKNVKVFFQYFSHRVLRWVACPILLPALLLCNFFLYTKQVNSVYAFFFGCQLIFYVFAVIGWRYKKQKGLPILFVPYYFVFMHLSLYKGLLRMLTKKQPAMWKKADRKAPGL